MTVAVSTASAIAQIQSVVPGGLRRPDRDRASSSISLITIANLRGLRESGNIFAVPTYLFVGLALAIVAIGAVRILGGDRAARSHLSRTPSRSAPMRSASCSCSRRSPAARSR